MYGRKECSLLLLHLFLNDWQKTMYPFTLTYIYKFCVEKNVSIYSSISTFWEEKNVSCSRTQLLLTAVYAVTIQRSKSLTIFKNAVDVGQGHCKLEQHMSIFVKLVI